MINGTCQSPRASVACVRKKERDCPYVLTVDLEVFGDRGAERQTRRLTGRQKP